MWKGIRNFLLTLPLLFSIPEYNKSKSTIKVRVDKIELNHVLNNFGEVSFSQIILWDYNFERNCYEATDYKMMNKEVKVSKNFVSFIQNKKIYLISSDYFEETYGTDHEMEDRERLSEENRKNLIQ